MGAANPLQGEFRIQTEDGREFTAVFDIASICALEDLLDRPSVQIAAQIIQGRIGFVRAGLLTGLRRLHPDLTPGDVERIMTTLAGDKLPSQIVLDGLNLAFPKRKKKLGEGDAPDPQTAPGEAGTGKPS